MKVNPLAVALWVFVALIGYLIDGTHGAVVGAVTMMTVSILVSILF